MYKATDKLYERQISGEPGLVHRVFAVYAGSRGFNSHWRHMSERFFISSRPGYPHPVCSEVEIVASEWRLVIAVSLNVGDGARLIKPTKLYANTLQTRRGRTHGAVCAQPWFRTAEPFGECRYENWITHIQERQIWTDARRPILRPWIRSAEVRGERRYEKGNTTTRRKTNIR